MIAKNCFLSKTHSHGQLALDGFYPHHRVPLAPYTQWPKSAALQMRSEQKTREPRAQLAIRKTKTGRPATKEKPCGPRAKCMGARGHRAPSSRDRQPFGARTFRSGLFLSLSLSPGRKLLLDDSMINELRRFRRTLALAELSTKDLRLLRRTL